MSAMTTSLDIAWTQQIFFANAKLKAEIGEIYFIMNGTEVVIVHRDIRVLFNFPVQEGEHPDYSSLAYNQEDLWRKVKGEEAPEELKFSLKKEDFKAKVRKSG